MSDSINISPRSAFSFHWNQCIDSNTSCFTRVGKSVLGFFRALFCGHPVCVADVKAFLENVDHQKSIFFKECDRKLKEFSVVPVNVPVSVEPEVDVKEQEIIKSDDKTEPSKSDKNDPLETIKHNLEEPTNKVHKAKVSVDELEGLMDDKDFNIDDERFLKDSLSCLDADDYCRLFNSALVRGQGGIASRLLGAENCSHIAKLSGSEKTNALSFCASEGFNDALIYLLENGTKEVSNTDFNGCTPLMAAVREGRVECVSALLLQGGAAVNVNDFGAQNMTPLGFAAGAGYVRCLTKLMKAGAKVDAPNKSGITPIEYAAMNGQEKCLKLLLGEGVNANELNATVLARALYSAVLNGHEKCIKVLLGVKGIQVDGKDDEGDTLVHCAIKIDNEKCLKALIVFDAMDIKARNRDGGTPLHCAATMKNPGCLNALLEVKGERAVDVNERDVNGRTPLFCALADPEALPCVKRLLREKGLNVDLKLEVVSGSTTLLHCAAIWGSLDSFRELLKVEEIYARINEKNRNGYTVLHFSVIADNIELVKESLKVEGINVNAVDNDGRTPLHHAAENCNIEYIELLLAATGIEASHQDARGDRPLDLLDSSKDDYAKCKKALEEAVKH